MRNISYTIQFNGSDIFSHGAILRQDAAVILTTHSMEEVNNPASFLTPLMVV